MKRLIILILLMGALVSNIQAGGEAGTLQIFSRGGVGARAMALGNAYVAMPFDATAIYWNPAGMEYVQHKSVSLFYTNLLESSPYNFIAYVHPTVNLGTFGLGAIRVGSGDIKRTDTQNVDEGTFSYNESQFLFAYAKRLPANLAAGINLKLHYFYMDGFSDTGIGADIGLLYRPSFSSALLRNISIGVNLHNILQPQLKPLESTDVHPYIVKFGVAKPLLFGDGGNKMSLFMDLEQGGGNSPFMFHLGSEYVFQERAMLRAGINNGYIAFGAGVSYGMYQLDYSYGKMAQHELNASHRISLTFDFGMSRADMMRIAEEKKLRIIEEQVAKKIEWDRNEKIARAMENGKRYMQDEDYVRAQREFNIVIGFESEIPEALEIKEAKELYALATEKYEDKTKKAIAEIQAKDALDRKKKEDLIYINDHFKRGLAFYENEEYERAIGEWNRILDRDPDNELAKEHIKKAQVDYQAKVYTLINRADAFGKQGKYVEAINILNQAIGLNPDDQTIKQAITRKRSAYENKLSFHDLYEQGQNYQLRKEYKKAMEAYERALAIEPDNTLAKKRYEEVKARAFARREPMTEEVRSKFLQSLRLINQGNYSDALKILEEIQKIQPYNKDILDGIDTAREYLERQNRR